MECDGGSCGQWQMPRHWIVGHWLERTDGSLRIRENQTGRGPGRVAPVSSPDKPSGVLQGEGCCALGFCPVGSRNEAGADRGSGCFGNRRTGWQDPGSGVVGLGGAAWHGSAYYVQECGPG